MCEIDGRSCGSNGGISYGLADLPGDLIDYIFMVANPNHFYLLAVLRRVSKKLWQKIPLTIYTYLADVGASFCGDLPVLKWIYNTTGIAHPTACITCANVTGNVPMLEYLEKYLALKVCEDTSVNYGHQAPINWRVRSIPRANVVPYILYRLSKFEENTKNLKDQAVRCKVKNDFNALMRTHYHILSKDDIKEIYERMPKCLEDTTKATQRRIPRQTTTSYLFREFNWSVLPGALEYVNKNKDNTPDAEIFSAALCGDLQPGHALALLSRTNAVYHATRSGFTHVGEAILSVNDPHKFTDHNRRIFEKMLMETNFEITLFVAYVTATWALPRYLSTSMTVARMFEVLAGINDQRICALIEEHSRAFDEWITLAPGTLVKAMQLQNFHVVKWFASARRQPWPLSMRSLFHDWPFEDPLVPTESARVLFQEFKDPDQGSWIFRNQYVFENRADLFEVVKTYGLVERQSLCVMHTKYILPAFFLASYHDMERNIEAYDASLKHERSDAESAFIFAFTALEITPKSKLIVTSTGNSLVTRGPRSSKMRKEALLATDPVFLHIYLRTAQHDFELRRFELQRVE